MRISLVENFRARYQKFPLAAKAAFWFVIGSFLQKCIGFITVPIFTRIMTTEQYGIYSSYMSIFSILSIIFTLSMEKLAYINGIAKSDKNERNEVAIPLLSLSVSLTLFGFLFYLLFRDFLNELLGMDTNFMILMFIQILFGPPVIFWMTRQRYEYKYISLVTLSLVIVIANSLLGILMVNYSSEENQAFVRVFSLVLVQGFIGILCYGYFITTSKSFFSTSSWLKTLSLQLPLLPHSLSLTILSSSDRIMINSIVGKSQAGIYSIAYSAGFLVTILKDSIVSAMTPWIYENIKLKNFKDIRRVTKPILLLVVLITFVFISFAPEIVYFLAPPQYYEAIYVIPPVAASSYFTFMYNMFSTVSFYYEKTKQIMYASLVGAVMNLILNYLMIPIYGYLVAGYTTLLCYIVLSFCHYLILDSVSREHEIKEEIFDVRFIIILSVFVLIITILFSLIYANVVIRYLAMILCFITVFIKRNIFINTFKIVRS